MKINKRLLSAAAFILFTMAMAAQNITVIQNNVTVKQAISQIKKNYGYTFVYSPKDVNSKKRISLSLNQVKIDEAIRNILVGQPDLEYEIQGKTVIIRKSNKKEIQNSVPDSKSKQTIHRVAGCVKDASGNPIIGATVREVGNTRNGTITNIDGNYSLEVPNNAALEFSYIGYRQEKIPSAHASTVIMHEDSKMVEEVVVIGYGTMKKRDLTGAISQFGADKIKERSFGNALQAMSGQVSGVQITQTQGAPGMAPTVKVRGMSSITSGTTPLYVIDGIPLEDDTNSGNGTEGGSMSFNRNPLNNINPNDIESIEVLKDASSAAIYGSRGSNGVVIITTKQGHSGKTKVDVNYSYSLSKVTRKIDMMNAPEWMEYETAARNNTYATNLKTNPNAQRTTKLVVPVEFSDPEWLARIGNGTDWQDVLFRTAHTHDAQITASGGSEKTQFLCSVGYMNQEGVVDNTSYDRISLRSNINHQFNSRLSADIKMYYMHAAEVSKGTAGKSDVVSLSVQNDPIFPLHVETGSLGFLDPSSMWNTFVKYGFMFWHPWSLTREMSKKKNTDNILINSSLKYKIIDGLSFTTSFDVNVEDSHYKSYWNNGQHYGYGLWVPAEGYYNTFRTTNWVWENTLNYNKTFGDHSLTGLLGYTMQDQKIDNGAFKGTGYPAGDLVHTLNAASTITGSTTETEWSLISWIARATYSYKDKYLASAAIRADGCSRFGKNNRYGYFPSASAAWRISEEPFMASARKWMDNLKIRLSYGETGNNQISNYGAIGLLGYSYYIEGNSKSSGLYTNTYPKPDLKWEKTAQYNLGIDVSVLNSRINMSLDLYYSKTKNILLDVPVPALTGFTTQLSNIGQLRNEGIELSLSTKNVKGVFSWSTDFNLSANRNKVLKLGNNNAPIYVDTNNAVSKTEVGQPVGNYFGWIVDGVLSTQDIASGMAVYPGSEAGDPKVRDVNGDNKIDSNDRTIIGNYQPNFTWGMTNNFSYKGIELSVMITGQDGGEIMNQMARFVGFMNGNRNLYAKCTNFWKSDSEPGDGKTCKPRITPNTVQQRCTTDWIEDATFVRLKNIRLGYNFPQTLISRLGITGLKAYVNLENVKVWSDYPNYDPECSTFQTGYRVGYDYGAYPVPFTATLGLSMSF
jgi:TonB-linked SusC/RagA family outer membrane protein